MRDMVSFDLPKLKRFKKEYQKYAGSLHGQSPGGSGDTFTFEGNEYVVGYAKYMIQYLEMQLCGSKKEI